MDNPYEAELMQETHCYLIFEQIYRSFTPNMLHLWTNISSYVQRGIGQIRNSGGGKMNTIVQNYL